MNLHVGHDQLIIARGRYEREQKGKAASFVDGIGEETGSLSSG